MDHGRVVKKIFERKLEEKGRILRLRWLKDVKKDLERLRVKDGDTRQWTEWNERL
jgi:hypothetical protein